MFSFMSVSSQGVVPQLPHMTTSFLPQSAFFFGFRILPVFLQALLLFSRQRIRDAKVLSEPKILVTHRVTSKGLRRSLIKVVKPLIYAL